VGIYHVISIGRNWIPPVKSLQGMFTASKIEVTLGLGSELHGKPKRRYTLITQPLQDL
jgi:hypothetical protein